MVRHSFPPHENFEILNVVSASAGVVKSTKAVNKGGNLQRCDREVNCGAGIKHMNISDIEVGAKYKCDYNGAKFFTVVIEKNSARVRVRLGDKIDEAGDAGSPVDRLGTLGPICVGPEQIDEI